MRTLRYIVIFLVAFVGLLSFRLHAYAQSDTKGADEVTLSFGWPEDLTAHVTVERSRERQVGDSVKTSGGSVSYRMRALPAEGGYLIKIDSFAVADAFGPGGSAGGIEVQAISQQLGNLVPSYRVSRNGEFLGIVDIDALRNGIVGLLKSAIPDYEDAPPEMHSFLESMLSQEVLTASAAQEWNALVGTWVGGEMEVGALYEVESDEPVPVMPSEKILTLHQFSVRARVPCTDEAPLESCVELEMRSFPDPEAMQAFLQRFLQPLAKDKTPVFESLEAENAVRVVADPATLQPYRMVVKKTVSGVGRDASGEEGSFSNVDQKVYIYRYSE